MKPNKALLGIAMGILLPLSSHAQFNLFDNFNSYTSGGNLIGQGPAGNQWAQTIGSPTGMVVNAFGGSSGVFVGPTSPSAAYRALGPAGLTIGNSSVASTVFFQFTLGSTNSANNWNFVVTDVNPTDTAGTSEVQFNYDATAGNFRARNAGAFKNLSITGAAAGNVGVVTNTTYNVWFEINNSSDNYKVFMQANGVAGLENRTQVLANDGSGGVFGFRNGTAGNDLTTVNFGSGNGQLVATIFDNIYVDVNGFDSANPTTVPEPTTWALFAMGGLALGWRARRVRA